MVEEPEAGGGHADPAHSMGAVGRLLMGVSRLMAWAGGIVFVALVVMLCISIVGRKLFGFVVPGDVEMLQMCAAVASAFFFPYCQMTLGDVKVDFFTHGLRKRVIRTIDAAGSLLVSLFGALIAWRSAASAYSIHEAGETSPVLSWPMWFPQALMVIGFVVLAVCGAYMAAYQFRCARMVNS